MLSYVFNKVRNTIRRGVAVLVKHDSKVAIIRPGKREIQVQHIFKLEDLELVDEIAVLCADVYEETRNPDDGDEREHSSLDGWHLLFGHNKEKIQGRYRWKYTVGGLGFQVWRREWGQGQTLVAIVFRGTDFKQIGDWFANLRWITRFIPMTWDQYGQVRDLLPEIVGRIKEEVPGNVHIVSAGHSLGGGLAQMAGYASSKVKHVYAFDSSFVTGYYSVPRKTRRQNANGLKTYRIYEHGEILAYIRLLLKSAYPVSNKNPKIIEIRVNFSGEDPLAQHSMRFLANKLTEAKEALPVPKEG